jgi:hypothetical protein
MASARIILLYDLISNGKIIFHSFKVIIGCFKFSSQLKRFALLSQRMNAQIVNSAHDCIPIRCPGCLENKHPRTSVKSTPKKTEDALTKMLQMQ